jgi:hypothetical protein
MTTVAGVGRIHVILPLGLMAIGLILMFDAFSSGATGQPSWFFQKNHHELEWFWGLCAVFAGTIWVGGRDGGSFGRSSSGGFTKYGNSQVAGESRAARPRKRKEEHFP